MLWFWMIWDIISELKLIFYLLRISIVLNQTQLTIRVSLLMKWLRYGFLIIIYFALIAPLTLLRFILLIAWRNIVWNFAITAQINLYCFYFILTKISTWFKIVITLFKLVIRLRSLFRLKLLILTIMLVCLFDLWLIYRTLLLVDQWLLLLLWLHIILKVSLSLLKSLRLFIDRMV